MSFCLTKMIVVLVDKLLTIQIVDSSSVSNCQFIFELLFDLDDGSVGWQAPEDTDCGLLLCC